MAGVPPQMQARMFANPQMQMQHQRQGMTPPQPRGGGGLPPPPLPPPPHHAGQGAGADGAGAAAAGAAGAAGGMNQQSVAIPLKSAHPFETGKTNEYMLVQKARTEGQKSIDWNCDGKLLACGFKRGPARRDDVCRIIDVEHDAPSASTGPVPSPAKRSRNMYASQIGGVSKTIAAVTGEQLRICSPSVFNPSQRLDGNSAGIVKWHTTDPHLLTITSDSCVQYFDIRESSMRVASRTTSDAAMKNPLHTAISPDGLIMVICTYDNCLIKIDLRTYKVQTVSSMKDENLELNEVVFSADSKLLYIAATDKNMKLGTVEMISVDTLKPVGASLLTDGHSVSAAGLRYKLIGHNNQCMRVDIDTAHSRLISGATDSLVNIWDLKSEACLYTIDKFNHSVNVVAFSHDGKYFIAGDGLDSKSVDAMKAGRAGLDASRLMSTTIIAESDTGNVLHDITHGPLGILSARWNPVRHVLAYSYESMSLDARQQGRDFVVRVVGL